MDREKVIENLTHLKERLKWQKDIQGYGIYIDFINGAIALLKEQKPIKPLKHNDDYSQYWQCGHCFEPLITVSNYCHKCGRKVQWDA